MWRRQIPGAHLHVAVQRPRQQPRPRSRERPGARRDAERRYGLLVVGQPRQQLPSRQHAPHPARRMHILEFCRVHIHALPKTLQACGAHTHLVSTARGAKVLKLLPGHSQLHIGN